MVTRIGWVGDGLNFIGGAEIADLAFLAAAPAEFTIVPCPSHMRPPQVDAFVVNNVFHYDRRWIQAFAKQGVPVIKHVHDLWPYGDPVLRRWLLDNAALLIFNSPKQRAMFPYLVDDAKITYVQVPVDVRAIIQARERRRPRPRVDRAIWLGRISIEKGIQNIVDWALRTDTPVDFYGGDANGLAAKFIVPPCVYRGEVEHDKVPDLLAEYDRFVYWPVLDDLYCLSTMEAMAAGCQLHLWGDLKAFYDYANIAECAISAQTFWRKVQRAIGGSTYG